MQCDSISSGLRPISETDANSLEILEFLDRVEQGEMCERALGTALFHPVTGKAGAIKA
jgi:hypothetical protein